MKKLLRQKANYVILEGLLSCLLRDDIVIKNIADSESNKDDASDKFNRVDILAQTQDGELVIIEVQVDSEVDYFHRMAYGTSKCITEYMTSGDAYMKVKKVYSVNIVYFDLGQGKDYVYHGTTEFRGLHQNDILQLSDKQKKAMPQLEVSDIFPEYYVLKVNDFDGQAVEDLDQWIYVLKTSEVKDGFTAKGLGEASIALQYEMMPEDEKARYRSYLDNKSNAKSTIFTARLEGKIEGRLEGERIQSFKTVLKALRKGMADGDIIELTEISLAELTALKALLRTCGDDAENHLAEL